MTAREAPARSKQLLLRRIVVEIQNPVRQRDASCSDPHPLLQREVGGSMKRTITALAAVLVMGTSAAAADAAPTGSTTFGSRISAAQLGPFEPNDSYQAAAELRGDTLFSAAIEDTPTGD